MFEPLKDVLIKMVAILMMSAKSVVLGLLQLKVLWNKGYDVIVFADDLTNKVLSCYSNHIVNVVIWPKFGKFSIFMKEVITTSIL